MPHVRGLEDSIHISEEHRDHGKCFVQAQIMSLVSNSHIAPTQLVAEFTPKHICASLFSCVMLLPVRFRFPVSLHFLSPSETLKGASLCVSDSPAFSVPALEQSVSSSDSCWLLKSPAF